MEFEVKMTSGILYTYLLRHNYLSFNGWVGVGLGFILIAFYFTSDNLWSLLAGLVVLIYPFLSLYTKSKKQMLLNPSFKNPLLYKIDDEGIRVSQGADEVQVNWEQLYKVINARKMILIYTSPLNAWIIPRNILAGKEDMLRETLLKKLPAAKIKKLK